MAVSVHQWFSFYYGICNEYSWCPDAVPNNGLPAKRLQLHGPSACLSKLEGAFTSNPFLDQFKQPLVHLFVWAGVKAVNETLVGKITFRFQS